MSDNADDSLLASVTDVLAWSRQTGRDAEETQCAVCECNIVPQGHYVTRLLQTVADLLILITTVIPIPCNMKWTLQWLQQTKVSARHHTFFQYINNIVISTIVPVYIPCINNKVQSCTLYFYY